MKKGRRRAVVMASPAISGPGILALMAGGAKTGRRCSRLMEKWPGSERGLGHPLCAFCVTPDSRSHVRQVRRPAGGILAP